MSLETPKGYQRVIENWIWPAVGAIFLVYVVKYLRARSVLRAISDIVDGPKPYPILGNLRELGLCNASLSHNVKASTVFNDIRSGVALLYEKEKMYLMWILGRPVVLLYSADVVEPLLTSSVSVNKSAVYDLTRPWLGNGLLTSKGNEWKAKRKMLTPTFHFKILQDFLPIMNHYSEILVNQISKNSNSSWIDIVPLLTFCTLDIISETAMGVKLNCQENPDSEYGKAVHYATYSIFSRVMKPWLANDFIYFCTKEGELFKKSLRVIEELTTKVIKDQKESKLLALNNKENGNLLNDKEGDVKKKRAFLDMLLERHLADPTFTEKDIADEVNTFMFAGHDTTSTSLTWILFLLGLHLDVQENVYQEILRVIGTGVLTPEVTQDDLRELKYMEMVMKESQRLYPSIPTVARNIEEDLKIGDKVIPKRTELVVFIQQLHKDKKVFPNPEHFDPERFSPENIQGRHPYAYIPFSAGPRNCIGQKFALMEQKVILCHVLLNFKVEALDQRDKITLSPDVVLRPNEPIRMTFQSRKN